MEYRIASFNMKNFGLSSSRKRDLSTIARIFIDEDLDVVAFQEILSEGKGIKNLLEELTKYELFEWEYCFESPRDTNDIDIIKNTNRSEGYAYLWNKKRFKIVEQQKNGIIKRFEPRIINSLSNDVNTNCSIFARAPYYIRLQPLYGGFFELRLINIHIYWGDSSIKSIAKRNIEFNILTQNVYPDISVKGYGNNRVPYTIAMGDYNLNLFSPYIHDKHAVIPGVYSYDNGERMINVLTLQEGLTTINNTDDGYANNYDHFTFSPELSPFLGVSVDTIDVVKKYCENDFAYYKKNISDHLPIVMKITI